MDQWVTIREAALKLGVSELTVRRRIKDGKVTSALRQGKYWVQLPGTDGNGSAAPTLPGLDASSSGGENGKQAGMSNPEVRGTASMVDMQALFEEHGRLALEAGRAAQLDEQLRRLQEQFASLQEGALALASRNGWLEGKLEEREKDIKLLSDFQHRRSWWRRLFAPQQDGA